MAIASWDQAVRADLEMSEWTVEIDFFDRRFVMQLDVWSWRRWVWGLMVCAVAIGLSWVQPAMALPPAGAQADAIEMTVYRDPSCRCCGGWMEHLQAEGFAPKNVPTEDMEAFKREHGISEELSSCHTAILEGYLIEGHVPVADIQRLLVERPAIAGIAVPGMPIGTPGMESEDGVRDPFNVVSFDGQGNSAVFREYLPEG